jgi:hypothetical protein
VTEIESPKVAVDALFLANGAELQAGLIYTLGGAWTRCWPPPGAGYPYERTIPTVVVIRVPWHETNAAHNFEVSYRDSDGADLITRAAGQFTVGRQPDLTDGASQIVALTLNPKVPLHGTGLYYVGVTIDGHVAKTIEFEAIAGPTTLSGPH